MGGRRERGTERNRNNAGKYIPHVENVKFHNSMINFRIVAQQHIRLNIFRRENGSKKTLEVCSLPQSALLVYRLQIIYKNEFLTETEEWI